LYSALWHSAYNVLGAPTIVEKALSSSWQCWGRDCTYCCSSSL